MHRIHVVEHALDDSHESWCSPDGRVVLLRDRGSTKWRAVLDLVLVTDADRLNGGLVHDDETTLQAASAEALAEALARQERVHVVFA